MFQLMCRLRRINIVKINHSFAIAMNNRRYFELKFHIYCLNILPPVLYLMYASIFTDI